MAVYLVGHGTSKLDSTKRNCLQEKLANQAGSNDTQ